MERLRPSSDVKARFVEMFHGSQAHYLKGQAQKSRGAVLRFIDAKVAGAREERARGTQLALSFFRLSLKGGLLLFGPLRSS